MVSVKVEKKSNKDNDFVVHIHVEAYVSILNTLILSYLYLSLIFVRIFYTTVK